MENYLVELGGCKDGIFRRNVFINMSDENLMNKINNLRKKLNNTDIYYTVLQASEMEREKGLLYGPLYLDLDGNLENEGSFEKIMVDLSYTVANLRQHYGIPEKMMKIYFSGYKGFHVVIEAEILGITAMKDLNNKYKSIAISLNKKTRHKSIDTGIYDDKRLFRFDCSINSKSWLYKVPIEYRKLKKMTMEELCEYAKEKKKVEFEKPRLIIKAKEKFEEETKEVEKKIRTKRSKDSLNKKLLPCTKNLLEEGVCKGSRNNMSVALASCLYQIGWEVDEVINELLNWNEKNEPPLPEKEIQSTAKSAKILYDNEKWYGCSFFKEGDYCIGKECGLF